MSGRKRTQKQRQKGHNKTCVLKETVGDGQQATLYRSRNRLCVQKKYSKKDFKQRENRIMTYINSIKSKSPYVIHGGLSSRECCKNSEGIPYIPPRGDYIFFEHIVGKDLKGYFQSIFQDVYTIDLGIIKTIFSNVLDGIEWLHRHNIAHGDIREDNIMWTGNDAIIVDFGAGLFEVPSPPTAMNGGSKSQITLDTPRNIISGDPLYSYTGTRDIEVMKTQDYKAIAVIFFRFVNLFMWKLYDNSNRNCYPFLPSSEFDQSLFERSSCLRKTDSNPCYNNFFNYNHLGKRKKLPKKYAIWNDTWKKLFSGTHILDIKFCNNIIDTITQTRSIAQKQNRDKVSNNDIRIVKIDPYSSSDKADTSQSASTHYTHLSGDTSDEPNISTASSQPVMVGPDSLEHIEGYDVGKRNKPVGGPRRKPRSRRRRRRRR